MQSEPTFLALDQAAARRLLLVRAIDEVDTQGKLLGAVEREQLEREALQASRSRSGEPDFAGYLQLRARKMLAAVENRNPQLAGAQEPESWRRWLLWALPLAACLLGAALDRVDNPQQVNMLSPPLLGVLFWNLAAYLLLLAALFLPGKWPGQGVAARLQRWLAGVPGGRTGRLRLDVLARFHQHWLRLAAAPQVAWGKTLLHLTAAGWAVGLALSIVLGGLVRQYRVGWESTLLDLGQVHDFLRLLFAPVVGLLPFDPFSAADLQRMALGSGAAIGVDEARRWVWMYLALLCLVVVIPRLLLAAWSHWRGRRLGAALRIDLREPYFAEVLARVRPARVTLGVLATDAAARDRLQRLLWQVADQPPPPDGGPWTVLASGPGDTLRVFDVPPGHRLPAAAAAPAATPGPGWLRALLDRFQPPSPPPALPALERTLAETDLLLLLPAQPADIDGALELLQQLQRPVLVLAAGALLPYQDRLHGSGLEARLMALDEGTAHWLNDSKLLSAVAGRLAEAQQAGFQRLLAGWKERNEDRFGQAMQLLARLLARAARESEELDGTPAGLRQLVHPSEREAAQRAREAAAAAVLERLRGQETATLAELVRLHRLELPPAALATARHDDAFTWQRPLDSRQAGMAGAGTGAAMGAGIDLLAGGLTLGAAAALGAVIGGGAAYVAAAWRNRATASGRAQLQLSDDMLQSLAESALLAYLAVAHRGVQPGAALPAAWRGEVAAAVAARRQTLAALWLQARNALDEEAMVALLAQELAGIARGLLGRL